MAQLCRRTCGLTLLAAMDGAARAAVATCLARMYSKPERVIASGPGVQEQFGRATGRSHFQLRFYGSSRFLPQRQDTLPTSLTDHLQAGDGLAGYLIDTNADQFRYAQACGEGQISMARSRMPDRVLGSGALSKACSSSRIR